MDKDFFVQELETHSGMLYHCDRDEWHPPLFATEKC